MLTHSHYLRNISGIVFFVLGTMTNPAWAEDQPQPDQPPPSENVSEEAPAQDGIQERGIPRLPGLQRRPVAPPSAGTGQSPLRHAPPPPPATATATAWANWINGAGPQAVPEETIMLGTFVGMTVPSPSPNRMVWKSSFAKKGISPACQHTHVPGLVSTSEDAPVVKINSFNVRYQIVVPTGSDADLRVVLTVPTLNGSEDYAGSIARVILPGSSSTQATIAFHPSTFRPQVLKFFNSSGALLDCFKIIPYLQPQLGAYVVPYLPVAIIYHPPGCGQCPPGSGIACGSTATYMQGSTVGTTLSWETSRTSGVIRTENSTQFFEDLEKFATVVSTASGFIPGGQAFAAGADTVSQVAGAVKGIWNTETITTLTQTQGQTQARGWSTTLSTGNGTHPCQSDLFVYLQDVLFVYAVVLKDPASGNISKNGEPTVILAPVRYSEPVHGRLFSQLQTELPAAIVEQFRALDLQMNPAQLRQAISLQGRGPRRLIDIGLRECPTETDGFVSAQQAQVTSSQISKATTTTTTKNVTGLFASITGKGGEVTQSVTHSSAVTNWQSFTQDTGLVLYCPDYLPAAALNVRVYFDAVFGTLLAVPAGVESGQSSVAGTTYDSQGQPASNREVVLKIGGKNYRVFSDASGQFVFRSKSIPKGNGTVVVGKDTFPITYSGTPLQNIKLRTQTGPTPQGPGKLAPGPFSAPSRPGGIRLRGIEPEESTSPREESTPPQTEPEK